MELIERDDETVVVRLSDSELTTVNNALNEILNGPDAIEDDDFDTRIGVFRAEAEELLRAIHDL